MPSRIPVCIAEHRFPSLNQARIHYSDILHRYQPGHRLNEEDRQQVMDLVKSSGAALSAVAGHQAIGVVRGYYGRPCFVTSGAGDDVQKISIMRSVKQCAARMSLADQKQDGVEQIVSMVITPCTPPLKKTAG